jgi:cellulose synthase/poly-beta-1,6-N-acetylglucosamine synthase-like glycosyltransferase
MIRDKMSSPPVTPEMIPIMSQAFHAGMKVLRYSCCPISKKMEADPISEVNKTNKTLIIMPMIRSFWRRFLRAASVSCRYALSMDFISLRIASMISLKSGNYHLLLI